jgi:hypothetical protein
MDAAAARARSGSSRLPLAPNARRKHEPRSQGVSRLMVFQAFGKKSGKMANASIRNLGRLTPTGSGGLSPFGRSARRDARTDSLRCGPPVFNTGFGTVLVGPEIGRRDEYRRYSF